MLYIFKAFRAVLVTFSNGNTANAIRNYEYIILHGFRLQQTYFKSEPAWTFAKNYYPLFFSFKSFWLMKMELLNDRKRRLDGNVLHKL